MGIESRIAYTVRGPALTPSHFKLRRIPVDITT